MSSPIYQCALHRFTHPDGTSKDWAICIDADVIRIFYAKTGAKMRMTVVPKIKISVSLDEEIRNRTDKQIQQGYMHVGEASIVDNAITQLIAPNSGKTLHWETVVSVPETDLLDKVREIAKDLGHNPYPGVTISVGNDGLDMATPGGKWYFGYLDSISGSMNRNTGRGGGTIPASHGPVPILIMLAVSMAFPDIFVFGDDDGTTIDLRFTADSPWFSQNRVPYEKLRKLAVLVGICAPSLSEINVKATGVWF
ncbi:MAG: hypothetical protein ACYC9J_06995 [Sulfuricaulis sp.]